jgi:uncharacterized protein (TIGR03067 family)
MKPFTFAILVLIVSLSLLHADDRNSDFQRSAGVWRLVSVTDNGFKAPEASLRGMTVTIAGNVYTIRTGDKVLERGTFVLDSSQNPKSIDATITEGPDKGKTSLGIYSLDDTWRKVCFAQPGKGRPTKLESTSGSNWALFVARRQSKDEAAKQELQQLQGDWQMESLERNGKKLDEALVRTYKRTVTGNKHTVSWEEHRLAFTLHATLTLDPTNDPKTVDLLLADGPFKGKTRLGIYKLEGDTETVCLAQPGNHRPTSFNSKQGAIHVWKRVRK